MRIPGGWKIKAEKSNILKEIVIDHRSSSQRFDKFLKRYLPNAGSSLIYKQLRKKNITLNGLRAQGSEILKDGDIVCIYFSNETLQKFMGLSDAEFPDMEERNKTVPSKTTQHKVIRNKAMRDGIVPGTGFGELSVIYENTQMILINKPAGVLSQKAGDGDTSMVEWMLSYLKESGQITREDLRYYRPGLVNRLDRNTSGLLIGAKTLQAAQQLSEALRERTAGKYYLALVAGSVEKTVHKKAWLKKDTKSNRVRIQKQPAAGADPIETEYGPVCVCPVRRGDGKNDICTLLRVELITGKTHQIRSHLASEGHPIIGDPKYGDPEWNRFAREKWKLRRQFLHAREIVFPDNFAILNKGEPRRYRAELPADLRSVTEYLGVDGALNEYELLETRE